MTKATAKSNPAKITKILRCLSKPKFEPPATISSVRPGNEQPEKHSRGASCLAQLHLSFAYYSKKSKRVRGICKFENFTLQRTAHSFAQCSIPDSAADGLTAFFHRGSGFAVRAILPRKREGRVRQVMQVQPAATEVVDSCRRRSAVRLGLAFRFLLWRVPLYCACSTGLQKTRSLFTKRSSKIF